MSKAQLPKYDGEASALQVKIKSKIIENYEPDSYHKAVMDLCRNGACGLEIISLAECRQVTDAGFKMLEKFTHLEKVCFLGCAFLKDEGLKDLVGKLPHLNEIDLGSTSITADGLRHMVEVCLNLKVVNITGCKKLNASDENILKNNNINAESGEDIFRFHLVPSQNSDLPKITNHILKTRSTLSLHKVYKYLVKKL